MSTTIYAGESSSGLVADYSNTIIVSGGTVTDTTIDYGTMNVFLAGALASNTVMSGGILYASGGRIENTTMDDGAVFSALYSVDITGTTINDGTASFRASSVKNTVVNSGGEVDIYGGTVTNTTVNPGGSMYLANSNTAAYNTVINGSNYTQVQVGNSASITGTTVGSNAYLRLSNGAIANDTILNSGGRLIVSNGATAANTTINEGGSMSIEGGVADLVTVNFGGYLGADYSYYGANTTASATRVTENGGTVYIGSGSSYEYDPELGSYTYKYFDFPVEFVSNTFSGLVYSNYKYGTVHSGTTAVDIAAVTGGLTVYSGGIVNGYRATPTTWTSTYVYGEYTSRIDEETGEIVEEYQQMTSSADVTTVGYLTVNSGGKVTGLVAEALPGLDNNMPYLNFQIARDTEIAGTVDGAAFEMKNGVLTNASLKDANLTYMSGANVSGVTQINGSATFLSASYARELNYSGGKATFSSGAAADGVKTFIVPYSYTEYGMGDSDSGTLVETSSGASIHLLFGATVTNLDMDSVSYLHMQVAPFTVLQGTSGGQAIDLKDGFFGNASLGNAYVEVLGPTTFVDEITHTTVEVSAGTVSNLIANMSAVVSANSGTTALEMTENGGAVYVEWDYENERPAANATFTSNTFSYDELRGAVTVHKNTVAQDNILYRGTLDVYSGGIVNNFYTAPKDMGEIAVTFSSGAIVSNLDMTRYAELPYHPGEAVFDGGVNADHVRLTDWNGLTLRVTADSVITNASFDNVPFSVTGGVLSGFTANDNGWFSDYITIGNGAKMIDSYIDASGSVELEDGASASNVTFANTYIYVHSGSLLENATIGLPAEDDGYAYMNYNSATVYVYDGGVVRDFTANEFSQLEVRSGGKLTGTMRFKENARVNAYGGAVIDFDLTSKDALSQARVDDLTAIDKNNYARYDIVVDAKQAAGSYVLAENYHSDYETAFNLVSVSGSTYGYFLGGDVYEVPGDPSTAAFGYIYHADSEMPQPGYGFKLDRVIVEMEEGAYREQLVLTVDSQYSPAAWLAAPTITADIATFTNQDVVLTATAATGASIEYSNDNGTSWNVFSGSGSVSENCRTLFRAKDAEGTVSDVVSYTVSNIDMVAPTVATDLSVTCDEESNVVLSWTDATDDFSGVKGFFVAYWQDGGDSFSEVIPGTNLTVDGLADGTWHWALQTLDYAGNASSAVQGADFVVSGGTVTPGPTPPTPKEFVTKSDIDGNGVSDVLFVWTGNNYQQGYWMNGTATWQSANAAHPSDWIPLGAHDMNNDGKADSVMFGNVSTETSGKGAYIGYYIDADDNSTLEHPTWQNIGYLNNEEGIAWQNCVGNLNGEKNSIVWYAPDLYATGIWVGADEYPEWIALSNSFGGSDWNLAGCGDFDGDGKDSVVMNYNNGQFLYTVDIDGTTKSLGTFDWRGWELRAIGDFAGDGKDDIVLFHEQTGSMVLCADGDIDHYESIGQLAFDDWFVIGAGDYNGDKKDDLLVRQKSTGMLGYYVCADQSQWVEMGRGVDMNWTVIA